MITRKFEQIFHLYESFCIHPEIIANPVMRAYNRLLIFMCLGLGGTRILMLLVMWGLTLDERYAYNALQLHLLTYCAVILKIYPSIFRCARWLLVIGHLRYLYAFCVVEDPLVSEALSALCIPIVSYYLGGRKAAIYSTFFIASTLSVFLFQQHTFLLSQSFEPYHFDVISIVWAIVGAGFVAGTYQHQRTKYHTRLLKQVEETNGLLEQMQQLTKTKQHFVAMSSHEIRNPLSVVLGRLELQHKRDPILADLENSLDKTQQTLDLVMVDIKQAIRLIPTTLLKQTKDLPGLISILSPYSDMYQISLKMSESSLEKIEMPGHVLAYVSLRLVFLSKPPKDGLVIELCCERCDQQNQLSLIYSKTDYCPNDDQISALIKDIGEPSLTILKLNDKRVTIGWPIAASPTRPVSGVEAGII